MTELLRKAFEEAAKLPPKEQDAFAALLLAELDADAGWDHAFGQSHEKLRILADEARSELKVPSPPLMHHRVNHDALIGSWRIG